MKVLAKNRFLFLLASILLLIVLVPILESIAGKAVTITDLFFTLILLSGVNAVAENTTYAITAAIFALLMWVTIWLQHFMAMPAINYISIISGIVFVTVTIVAVLSFIAKQQRITTDLIAGVLVVYLLIGVLWGFIYTLIHIAQPGSFSIPVSKFADSRIGFLYFSFVTLTTLGYGDMTPVTPTASAFAVVEAIVGQLYVAVLIARIVGLSISQPESRKPSAK